MAWISSTRRSAEYSPKNSRSPVFTGGLLAFPCVHCRLAGLLRHAHASRVLGLLRGLRPIRTSSVGDGPARLPAGCRKGGATPGWFPRSPRIRSRSEVPASTPAASPRLRRRPSPWPPHRIPQPASESNPALGGVRALRTVPYPSGLSPALALRDFQQRFLAYTFSFRLPDPDRLTVPTRPVRCQGCSHRPARPCGPAALSFTVLLRQGSGGVLSPPLESVAPRGARGSASSGQSPRWS